MTKSKLQPVADAAPGLGLELNSSSRVLVLGGYGVRNVGDEAILAGLLTHLRGVQSVTVVSRNPRETKALHGVEAVSPAAAAFALPRCDALIVGGGGIFSSDTGPFGRFIPLFCRLALVRGLPVAFHSVGVYSSTSPGLMKDLVRLASRFASFTVRDSASVCVLGAAGVVVEQVPDLSESMPLAREEAVLSVLDSAGVSPGRPTVGLCLTSVNESVAQFLMSSVPALCEAMPETQFCFVPMSQHPTRDMHNDLNLGRSLQAQCPGLKLVVGVPHPSVIAALFSRFSVAVCVRYHSYLFAERAGTPIVAVPYAEKCRSWLDDRGLQGIETTPESLIEAVRSASQPLSVETRGLQRVGSLSG